MPAIDYEIIAHEWYRQGLFDIPFRLRCAFCAKTRWFCKNRNGLELCKSCFEYWYKDNHPEIKT